MFGGFGTTGGTPFGSTPSPFGQTTTPAFGAPAASTPFGAPATSTPFGGFGATSTPSAFGAPAATTSTPFGATSTFGATSSPFGAPAATSPFGAPAASGSLFGATTTSTSTPFGGFGATSTPTSTFGATAPSTGIFGASTTPSTGIFGASTPFGAPNAAAPFGSPMGGLGGTTSTPFGGASTGMFGQPAASSPFGTPAAAASGTGNPPYKVTQDNEVGPGNANQTVNQHAITMMPAYSGKSFDELRWEDYQAKRINGVWSATPAASPFGSAASTPFGSATSASPFGSAPAATPFGSTSSPFGTTPATSSPFGATPAATPFGSTPSPFGTTSSTPFGQTPAATPFGQTPAATSPFGQTPSTNPSPFGTTSSTPFGQTPAATTSPFGTSTFGQTPAANPSPFGTSTFGQTPAASTSPFGTSTFGQTPQPASSAAGSSLFSFGTTPQTPTQPAASPFGTSTFGQTPAATSPFGQTPSTTSPFGSTPSMTSGLGGGLGLGGSTSLFGQSTTSTAPLFSGLGSTPSTTFGTTTSSPFGTSTFSTPAPTTSLFGNPTTSPFGAATTTSTPFSSFSTSPIATAGAAQMTTTIKDSVFGNLPNPETLKATPVATITRESPAKTASITPAHYKLTPRSAAKIKPRGYGGKLSLFDESSSASTSTPAKSPISSSLFVARPSIKKLVIDQSEEEVVPTPPRKVSSPVRNNYVSDDLETSTISSSSLVKPNPTRKSPDEFVDMPYLTDKEYYTVPGLEDLRNRNLSEVVDFSIGKYNVGCVRFLRPVDITGLDLNRIVIFSQSSLTIYPDDDNKPPLGEGLNQPAVIILENVFPSDKTAKSLAKYEEKLIRSNKKHGARFIGYNKKLGTWEFEVDHFSQYTIDDSDEDSEDNSGSEEIQSDLIVSKPQQAQEIKKASTPSNGKFTIISDSEESSGEERSHEVL
eukprot:TRINITY_DN2830_c0_g1_i2.p1 TRINITY_DN2830_c0_g1~~TRINITY_DN2830_c0_g1_i2.p1  ORF type:complete len:931 (+),score=287.12 TRINITY_DN2830_c0_g1_i2:104-2896(+)